MRYSAVALRQEAAHPSGPVIVASSAGCLAQIATGTQTLAIWRRSAPEGQSEWLDGLPASQLPEGQFVTAPGSATAPLQRLADGVALPPSPQRDWLIGDIAMLVDCFAQIARCEAVNVRLEAIDHDACWRFHRDYVGLRLNATYRGPGTQWLPPERADAALRGQRRYRGPLNELPRFSVGLFKGVVQAGNDAIVHRSPPVARHGLTRLFLCLDAETCDD